MSIKHDSRQISVGDIFFAIPGAAHDGRSYIEQALNRGASKIYYERQGCEDFDLPDADVPMVAIDDLQHQQGAIAAEYYGYPSRQLNIIGITGTNGKTSISYFLAQCLNDAAIIGTTGYGRLDALHDAAFTTPFPSDIQALLQQFVNEGVDHVAMEVSSHALDQGRVNAVEFDAAIFSNLSRDHLDYHGTLAAYAVAKKKLFDVESLRFAVVNKDDPVGCEIINEQQANYPILSYSLSNQADIYAHNITSVEQGFLVDMETPWGRDEFMIPLLGAFNIANVMAVICVLGFNGMPLDEIKSRVLRLLPPAGRMQLIASTADRPHAIIDYSHTPDALKQALTALRSHCQGKLYCIFGCGGDRDQGKRVLMGEVASTFSDGVFVTNDNPRTESPEEIAEEICKGIAPEKLCGVILDRRKAIEQAFACSTGGDYILIAGKGHETYQVIGDETLPFNDGTVVKETLDL